MVLMVFSDWMSLIAVFISFTIPVISHLTSTKKYELFSQKQNDIIDWFSQTILCLSELRSRLEEDTQERNAALWRLSSQIEIGRFFFPNVDRKDGYGNNKPAAYRGYRNICIEFLVMYYQICELNNKKKYKDHLYRLQREYVSFVFDLLEPQKKTKSITKYTGIIIKEIDITTFLDDSPDKYIFPF